MNDKEFSYSLFLEFLIKAKGLKIVEENEFYIKLFGKIVDQPIILRKSYNRIPTRIFEDILKKAKSSSGEFYQWQSTQQ